MNIRIVVTWSGGIFDRFARWWGVKWTHVALVYTDEADNLRVFETAFSGTAERDWFEFINGVAEHEFYRAKKPFKQGDQRLMLAYAWGNVGKTYNFFHLIWIAIRYLIQGRKPLAFNVRSHICSSFVESCYNFIGIDLVPGDEVWVTPDDIANSPNVERKLEG
jgi:hypothetical protein